MKKTLYICLVIAVLIAGGLAAYYGSPQDDVNNAGQQPLPNLRTSQ